MKDIWFWVSIALIIGMHNGQLGTEKIFKKVELGVSMASLTPNLENVCQKSEKKWKKSLENDGIWTTDFHKTKKKWLVSLVKNLKILDISKKANFG